MLCGTQRDSTTRYCCMALFRPIWPTRSTGYCETTNKIWTQLSNFISNINNIMKPYEWPNSKWPSATCEWRHRGILSAMTSEQDYGLNARNVKYVNLTNINDKHTKTSPVSISHSSICRTISKAILSYCVKQFVNKYPFNVSNNSNNHINYNPNRLLHIVFCS